MKSYNGVVYPAMTDAMGHMNVQHYVAAFDQAMWQTVAALGYDTGWQRSRRQGWADVLHETNFMQELEVGALFEISTVVDSVGTSSLTLFHTMRNRQGGTVATMRLKTVYFDLTARRATALPDILRNSAQKYLKSQVRGRTA